MSDTETSSITAQSRVVFRRATTKDAFDLARATFLADERVDMQTLATELGISRATLHRWVQTREDLLDGVFGELAAEFFAAGRAQATGAGDDAVIETARIVMTTTAALAPIRGFVKREPELAMRLMIGERCSVRRRLLEGFEELIAEVLPDEADQLRGFAETFVQVGLTLSWPTLVAGDEPSGEQLARVARALLAGARAGELRAGPA